MATAREPDAHGKLAAKLAALGYSVVVEAAADGQEQRLCADEAAGLADAVEDDAPDAAPLLVQVEVPIAGTP